MSLVVPLSGKISWMENMKPRGITPRVLAEKRHLRRPSTDLLHLLWQQSKATGCPSESIKPRWVGWWLKHSSVHWTAIWMLYNCLTITHTHTYIYIYMFTHIPMKSNRVWLSFYNSVAVQQLSTKPPASGPGRFCCSGRPWPRGFYARLKFDS